MTGATAVADAFLAGDLAAIDGWLNDESTFHSPVTDYTGRAEIMPVLTAVTKVASDLRPTSRLEGHGECVVLFSGRIGERGAEGIVHVAAPDGAPISMTLMIRPLDVLLDAVKRMGRALQGGE